MPNMRFRTHLRAIIALVFATQLVTSSFAHSVAHSIYRAGPPLYPPAIGDPHPDFSALDQDGLPFDLAGQLGKAVLIHWCAIWCQPCRNSAQVEDELVAELDLLIGADSWVLIDALLQDVVAQPATQADAQLWRSELGTPARTIHPDGDPSAEMLILGNQIAAIPLYVVVDIDGEVTALVEGFDTGTADLLVQLVRDAFDPPVFIDGFEA